MHDAKKMSDVHRTGIPEEWKDVPLNCVAASAAPGESFFVVMTITRGQQPEVTREGSGLDAKVSVGRQAVMFDGHNLVIGKGQ